MPVVHTSDSSPSASRRQALTPASRRTGAERLLIGLELFLGVTAVFGGLALILRPDGSLLQAKLSALRGTPFPDWRIPGVCLLTFIGGGSLLTALWLWRRARHARELALFTAAGVIAFELVEWVTIGFQILEAVVGVLALLTFVLAWRLPERRRPSEGA